MRLLRSMLLFAGVRRHKGLGLCWEQMVPHSFGSGSAYGLYVS